MNRYIAFGITILLGLIASLYLAWGGEPNEVRDASPDLLRQDFRADFALMVAESFSADGDIDRAIEQLVFLDAENPLLPVNEAIEFGEEAGYSESDLALLEVLAANLRALDPSLAGTPTP